MRWALLVLAVLVSVACGRYGANSGGHYDIRTPDGERIDQPPSAAFVAVIARSSRTGLARRIEPGVSRHLLDQRTLSELERDESVELWVSGFRPLPLPDPAPDVPLTLRKGIPVTFRVESQTALPSDGLELHLEITWRGSGELPEAPLLQAFPCAVPDGWTPAPAVQPGSERINFTADRPDVPLRFSFPGRYRVTWGVYEVKRRPGSFYSAGGSSGFGTNVVINEEAGRPQVITLRIPEVALANAIAARIR